MKGKLTIIKRGIIIPVVWNIIWLLLGGIVYEIIVPFTGEWTELTVQLLIYFPVALFLFRRTHKRRGIEKIKLKKPALFKLALGFALLVCVPTQMLFHCTASTAGDTSMNIASFLIITLLTAPVIEELAYRGTVFGLSRNALSFWPAAIFSTFMFQIAHTDLLHVVVTLPLALINTSLYETTGNIKYGMILHAVCNVLALLMVNISVPVLIALPVYLVSLTLVIACCIKRAGLTRRMMAGTVLPAAS